MGCLFSSTALNRNDDEGGLPALVYVPPRKKDRGNRPKIRPERSVKPPTHVHTGGSVLSSSVKGIVISSLPWQFVANISPPDNITLDYTKSVPNVQPPAGDADPKEVSAQLRIFGQGARAGSLGLDKVSPTDIYQGYSGDCWFLSALAVIAEYPQLVLACFPDGDKPDPSGAFYNVKFVKDGRTVIVKVDASLYADDEAGEPLYAKLFPHDNPQFSWVAIIEKAYAKLHGGFKAINGGLDDVSFRNLTGAPAFTLWISAKHRLLPDGIQVDSENAWSLTLGFYQAGCLLAAAHEGVAGQEDAGNLPDGHAFSILHVIQVTEKSDGSGDRFRLLNLRNPWGTMEWSGDWSARSAMWKKYPGVARQIEQTLKIKISYDVNDGDFWITWEDFITFGFYATFISFSPTGLVTQHIPGVLVDGSPVRYQLTTGSAAVPNAYIAISQEDPRLSGNSIPPTPLNLTLQDSDGRALQTNLTYSDQSNMYTLIWVPNLPAQAAMTLIIRSEHTGVGNFPCRYVLGVTSDALVTVGNDPNRVAYPTIR
eukprot:TRINITY_DN90_c1_g1_i1.p1 TRINITY_DN90_c1_g1~~TRINITY_DN90_c1_g1_i1.p1  ORF type:complete len:538 (+),score=62.97 TRINITY_DN90_c1_g1_i1:160-1773(+)